MFNQHIHNIIQNTVHTNKWHMFRLDEGLFINHIILMASQPKMIRFRTFTDIQNVAQFQ